MDWRHNAVCRGEDPDLFFPIGNTGPALLQIEEAKAVCRRCPVMEHCLQWALESGQDSGVWGEVFFTFGMSHETSTRTRLPSSDFCSTRCAITVQGSDTETLIRCVTRSAGKV